MAEWMSFDEFGQQGGSSYQGADSGIPDAVDCMRCGVCLSVCPTYRLDAVEAESPRSRIRTIARLVAGQGADDAQWRHLENCLQCRACEQICPSRMAYGRNFDQALASRSARPGVLGRLALGLIEHKIWRRVLLPAVYLYWRLGLQILVRRSGLLDRLGLAPADAVLGQVSPFGLRACYPARGAVRGRVALFTGCLAEHFDRETLLSAIKLLNAIGYEVLVPAGQGCCGAIHQHNGLPAADMIGANVAAFSALPVEAVLYSASGCGAMLTEYPDGEAASFKALLSDVNEFLLNRWPEDLQLAPAKSKFAVHEACSQRNVLKNQEAVYRLLEKIPEAKLEALADNGQCCGAGGSYFLTHGAVAGQLRQAKLEALAAAQADCLVSCNYGCMAYLAAATDMPVKHVVTLLAEHLP